MMTELEVDGARVHYDVTEPSSPPAGATARSPLLLTHGLWMDSGMWGANVAPLALSRRVVTWDLRGHGRTETELDERLYTEDLCLRDMVGILDALDAPRAVLGGHSLGGYLTLAFTLRHPERVDAVVLCATGPGFRDPIARERWNRRVREESASSVGGSKSRRFPAGGTGESFRPDAALAAQGIAVFRDSHVIDSLTSIQVPALVIVGDRDRAFAGASRYLAAKIPDARLVVLADAGHAPNLDQPRMFDEAVETFLDTVG